jgi:hypothetical protein
MSVEEEIHFSGPIPNSLEMLAVQSLQRALNGDPFDVIREMTAARALRSIQNKAGFSSLPSPAVSVNSFALRRTGLGRLTGIGSDAGTHCPEVLQMNPFQCTSSDQHLTSRGTGKNLHAPSGERRPGILIPTAAAQASLKRKHS